MTLENCFDFTNFNIVEKKTYNYNTMKNSNDLSAATVYENAKKDLGYSDEDMLSACAHYLGLDLNNYPSKNFDTKDFDEYMEAMKGDLSLDRKLYFQIGLQAVKSEKILTEYLSIKALERKNKNIVKEYEKHNYTHAQLIEHFIGTFSFSKGFASKDLDLGEYLSNLRELSKNPGNAGLMMNDLLTTYYKRFRLE
ncbi:MAG: hypothetical protein WC376_04020 [Candidatus Nanoarchaeia archaeon]